VSEATVRQAFAEQAEVCAKLGSEFTGRLCDILARVLDQTTATGRRVLGWRGPPDALHDNVPLRLTGALHALVRSGKAPNLARLYPPAPLPDETRLAEAVVAVLCEEDSWLEPWLDRTPQTNEVGRSAILMTGLLAIAERFPLPMRVYELGASAGLNLLLDRFGYVLGGLRCGQLDSAVQLHPRWTGGSPPNSEVRIAGRSGVDRDPLDAVRDADTLLAYVWPDQPERLARLEAALAIARSDPPHVAKADAADWIEQCLPVEPQRGVTRVVQHSIAFQYFPPETQARVRTHIERAGAAARDDAPLAWLRFEMLPEDAKPSVRLRTWPGDERLLAWAHPHGSSVEWLEA
jgi:hypothetical protein